MCLKGKFHEIFEFMFYFVNHFHPGPDNLSSNILNFLLKCAKIFAVQGLLLESTALAAHRQPISLTPTANLLSVSRTPVVTSF